MRTNDEALLKIKYNVLHEVAKLAFSGELDEDVYKRQKIMFKMAPISTVHMPVRAKPWVVM